MPRITLKRAMLVVTAGVLLSGLAIRERMQGPRVEPGVATQKADTPERSNRPGRTHVSENARSDRSQWAPPTKPTTPTFRPEIKPEIERVEPASVEKRIGSMDELFKTMKDAPAKRVVGTGSDIRIDVDGVCASDDPYAMAGLSVAIYQGDELLGYHYVASPEDLPNYFNGHSLAGVIDATGELIGFRNRVTFYRSTRDFIALSGAESGAQEEALDEGYIYGPQNGAPIGKFNSESGSLEGPDGVVVGKIDSDRVFLPLRLDPVCDESNDASTTVLLEFASTTEFEQFVVQTHAQLLTP